MTVDIKRRLEDLDWKQLEILLDEFGCAKTPVVLTPQECGELIALYPEDQRFRSTIDMARYRFGIGEYRYFSDPLPPVVQALRTYAYPSLALIANRWMEKLGESGRYPADLDSFVDLCRRQGQSKPTPLILRYESGGYNCLHQDLYGEVAFPLQFTCVLSRKDIDYTGGELLFVEQRPRAQSRGEVLAPEQGELVMFANRYRPVAGAKGFYRTNLKHGVSRLTSGRRYSLGIIFHNAK